jgi:hypothetical protein
MTRRWAITRRDCRASLGPIKPLRFAATPSGLAPHHANHAWWGPRAGLTGPPGRLVLAIT